MDDRRRTGNHWQMGGNRRTIFERAIVEPKIVEPAIVGEFAIVEPAIVGKCRGGNRQTIIKQAIAEPEILEPAIVGKRAIAVKPTIVGKWAIVERSSNGQSSNEKLLNRQSLANGQSSNQQKWANVGGNRQTIVEGAIVELEIIEPAIVGKRAIAVEPAIVGNRWQMGNRQTIVHRKSLANWQSSNRKSLANGPSSNRNRNGQQTCEKQKW